jgi:AbrB family looped-hinge helix DNA binding protein
MTTTISSKGQITVPLQLREALGLVPGTKIELKLGPRGTFVARKRTGESYFAKFQGIGSSMKAPCRDSHDAMDLLRGPVAKGDVD